MKRYLSCQEFPVLEHPAGNFSVPHSGKISCDELRAKWHNFIIDPLLHYPFIYQIQMDGRLIEKTRKKSILMRKKQHNLFLHLEIPFITVRGRALSFPL